MVITRDKIVEKLAAYLSLTLSLSDLVDWAETAMMDAEFDESDFELIRSVIAQIGLADVRAFNLSWQTCVDMLNRLGYVAQVQIVAKPG